jgi:putative protein-disulfide isomerase
MGSALPESAPRPELVGFVDPMCSWCYGFQPVIDAIQQVHGAALPLRLIMGGLRPGTVEPMSESMKRMIRQHWDHVHEATRQPFDPAFFDRDRFVYDTEPPARAVVTMRELRKELELPYFERLQRAFYAENRDITDADVLADLAGEFNVPRATFLAAFASEAMKTETASDFMVAQRIGATGFPTLIAGTGDERGWTLITEGYRPPAAVLDMIEVWRMHNP